MVDGLGEKLEVQAKIFQSLDPFTKFVQARALLQLAEVSIDKKARADSRCSRSRTTTALVAAATVVTADPSLGTRLVGAAAWSLVAPLPE